MSTAKKRIARRKKNHTEDYRSRSIHIGSDPAHVPYHPFYEQELSQADIAEMSSQYMEEYEKIEKEFKIKTKLNGLDYKFLFLATALQIVRQQIFSNDKFRIDSKVGDTSKSSVKKKIFNIVPEDMQKYVEIIFGKAPYDKIIPGLSGTNEPVKKSL